jgi:hypothetical protein
MPEQPQNNPERARTPQNTPEQARTSKLLIISQIPKNRKSSPVTGSFLKFAKTAQTNLCNSCLCQFVLYQINTSVNKLSQFRAG